MLRRSFLVPFGLLLLGLTVVPACRKKGATEAVPDPSAPPATPKSEHLLFAHLDAKQLRDSAIFAEIKKEFTKAGGGAEWNEVEKGFASQIGFKPTDIDAVTVCSPGLGADQEPEFVFIVAGNKALPKSGAFGLTPNAKPDNRGLYKSGRGFVHFPDEKTLVFVSAALVPKYLGGYAKDRTAWPLTADLSKAAVGHTLFMSVQLDKLPAELKTARDMKQFGPLLAAQAVTLTGDLKDKSLTLAGRATFANAADAGKAKDKSQEFIKLATNEIGAFLKSKQGSELGSLLPAVKEADRALNAAKLDVSGADLTLVADYKADFDFGAMVAEAVVKVREAAARMKVSNNLKQIGLALHSYHDTNNRLLVHGTGAKGMALTKPTEKALLSWRVAILPYIEQGNLYKQFKLDEPWDGPNNKKLIEKMPALFAPVSKPGKPGYTHLQMVIGPKAMQPTGGSLISITDGTSNTIAVVEAADPVIWTKPDDVMLPGKDLPKDLKKKFGGQFKGGFLTLFWDGSVRFISDSITDQTLEALLSPAGGEVPGSDF